MTISRDNIYTHVRTYFELEDDEMPASIIDRWVSEGWTRIIRKVPNWPGYERDVPVTTVVGTPGYVVPAPLDPRTVTQVRDITVGYEATLGRIDVNVADRLFPDVLSSSGLGEPTHWIVYQGSVYFYPRPNVVRTYSVRGYRSATRPLAAASSAAIDLPSADLEDALLAFVMSRACHHQYETEQAAVYQSDFDFLLRDLQLSELHAPTTTPIVLNSQRSRVDPLLPDRLRYDWE